jgi:hypothetical protein
MYHYNPGSALDELREDAALPNPVHLRDMILRRDLAPVQALEMNRQFQNYQKAYAEAMQLGRTVLEVLAGAPLKSS